MLFTKSLPKFGIISIFLVGILFLGNKTHGYTVINIDNQLGSYITDSVTETDIGYNRQNELQDEQNYLGKFYTFSVPTTSRVEIWVHPGPDYLLDNYVYLTEGGPTGNVIAYDGNWEWFDGAWINQVVSGGTYTIEVTDNSPDNGGDFTLYLKISPEGYVCTLQGGICNKTSWLKQIGSGGNEYAKSITVDNQGNSYSIGYFSNSLDFNGTNLSNSGYDTFVSKLNTDGNNVWVNKIGGTNNEVGYDINSDATGNTYVIGYFDSVDAKFGGYTLSTSGNTDIFISKLDTDGNFLRAKSIGGTGGDGTAGAISTDSQGNVYIISYFGNTINIGGTILTVTGYDSIYNSNILLSKLDTDGNFLWSKQISGANLNGSDIIVDNSGSIYIIGEGNVVYHCGQEIINSGQFSFISKLDNNGECIWAKALGGSGSSSSVYANSITIDSENNLYVVGLYSQNIILDGIEYPTIITGYYAGTHFDGDNGFFAKLDTNGNYIRSKLFRGDEIMGLDAKIGNNIIYALFSYSNYRYGSFYTDMFSLPMANRNDNVVVKMDLDGNELGMQMLGGDADEDGSKIAIDQQDNIYIIGSVDSSTSNGRMTTLGVLGYSMESSLYKQIYMAKLEPTDFNGYLMSQGYQDSVGALTSVSPGTFIGNKPLSLSETYFGSYTGLLYNNIIFQSTDSNKIETVLSENTILKTNNGASIFTGSFIPPVSLPVSEADEIGGTIVSVMKVGDSGERSIQLKNESNNDVTATVRMPVIGKTVGNNMVVYSSLDGISWSKLTDTTVIDIGGISYVEFTTTHFTYFAIGEETGSFVINNDDATTTSQTVTLTISASGSQYMRFSNDGSNRSTWEAYTTSKSWDLSAGNGTKTVYAEFDIDGDFIADISTSDTIDFNGPNAEQGQLSLEILTGISECVYGTSLYLGEQDVKLNSGYTFTGSFSGQRYCADYVGISSGWVFTIGVSDLDNGNGGIISGSNLSISHGGAITQGDSACTGYDGAASEFYTTPYTLIEKAIDSNKICKVTLDSVDIEINVPANQAPGNYAGTLTIYVPNF